MLKPGGFLKKLFNPNRAMGKTPEKTSGGMKRNLPSSQKQSKPVSNLAPKSMPNKGGRPFNRKMMNKES